MILSALSLFASTSRLQLATRLFFPLEMNLPFNLYMAYVDLLQVQINYYERYRVRSSSLYPIHIYLYILLSNKENHSII